MSAVFSSSTATAMRVVPLAGVSSLISHLKSIKATITQIIKSAIQYVGNLDDGGKALITTIVGTAIADIYGVNSTEYLFAMKELNELIELISLANQGGRPLYSNRSRCTTSGRPAPRRQHSGMSRPPDIPGHRKALHTGCRVWGQKTPF